MRQFSYELQFEEAKQHMIINLEKKYNSPKEKPPATSGQKIKEKLPKLEIKRSREHI